MEHINKIFIIVFLFFLLSPLLDYKIGNIYKQIKRLFVKYIYEIILEL